MNRRGQHEGNVYRRADGRWEARLQLGYADGRRVRRSFYSKTRAEVIQRLSQAQRQLHDGYAPRDERLTVERYLTEWLAESVKPRVRPSTYRSYEMLVRQHLVPDLGRQPLAKLTAAQVQALLNRKLAAGLSPRSVHHVRAVLRRALNQAVRWGLVARNVATLVDAPLVPRFEVAAMSPEQAKAFLSAVSGDRLEALYTAALATGLRQGELLGLRWADVDLDHGELNVRHALQRIDGTLQLVQPKTNLSRRRVALAAIAVGALRRRRTQQLQERLFAGSLWQESDFVFTTVAGAPLDGVNVTHHLQDVLHRAHLPRMRFHDLRHACATLLLAQGVHPRVVMETLGHSQISLTMNTYSHVIPALQRDAADRIDDALGGRESA